MRIHLLGLPNAPVHPDFCLDGFAQATHRFARMMDTLGHEVYLYGAEGSNAPCKEFIPIISEKERVALLGKCEYQHACFDDRYPLWQRSNACAAAEIATRKQPRDLLLTIGGLSQKPVFDFHPDLLGVEYSIGYEGNFAQHRVFESAAWMHYCYGQQGIVDGRFYDTVIPLFFDEKEFTYVENPDDYFLFVGRLTPRKGIGIACQAATAAGVKLKVVGHGDPGLVTGGHEYLGAVGREERNHLMAHARALIAPTQYIEPFGATSIEAQLCGTPVISTDFGGFTETVENGVSGFRCSYLGEFIRAVKLVHLIDRSFIWRRANRKYAMKNLATDYEWYFRRLATRWGEGWNSLD